MLRLIAFALVSFALVAGNAVAAKGGPVPGVVAGWDGTVDASSGVRYVALPDTNTTAVAAVRMSDGRVLRFTTIPGTYGVPLVAFDGTAEGISHDGKTLVLASVGANEPRTRFAVLSAGTLRFEQVVTLRGVWAYDALSPDGRTLYATQYLGPGANARYNVRSVSLVTGKPVGGALVDRREPDEEMNGSPYARARSSNGSWAYTLYAKPNGTGFVHAAVRLRLAKNGRSLELAKPGGSRLAVVDTTSFKVMAYAKP